MKHTCLICGEDYETSHNSKFCPDCRAEGKRICTKCGKVFATKSKTTICHVCASVKTTKPKQKRAPRERIEKHVPKNPQSLADKVRAARELGMSYGKYSAVRRGLLRV